MTHDSKVEIENAEITERAEEKLNRIHGRQWSLRIDAEDSELACIATSLIRELAELRVEADERKLEASELRSMVNNLRARLNNQ